MDKNSLNEIIEKSGHGFHSRVVKLLRSEELKWKVLVSPYYSDNFTNKPREIDIIAEKEFPINKLFGGVSSVLTTRLLIECKYINNDTILWFDKKHQEKAVERMMNDTGLEDPRRNTKYKKHHYFSDEPVAKLFSSTQNKNNKSEDNETLSKAINQILNATVYYRDKDNLFLSLNQYSAHYPISRLVPYPIIVIDSFDRLFNVDMADEAQNPKPITEPFQIEVNYAYLDLDGKSVNEYFLVDVVSFDKLLDFLKKLEGTDITEIVNKLEYEERINYKDNSIGDVNINNGR